MATPTVRHDGHPDPGAATPTAALARPSGHQHADSAHAGQVRSAHEAMGHGGRAGMSTAAMVTDMRNRFLVAATLSIPIVVWSPIGTDVFGLHPRVPFGLREDVWALLLSLPVIFYSCWIFFDSAGPRPGHVRAPRPLV